MKRMAFNPRFVNGAGDDLIPGKIHTIRRNFLYWKKLEGREVALFTWEGKPYRSKQKVFSVKQIVSVQKIIKNASAYWISFFSPENKNPIPIKLLARNDGFKSHADFIDWFFDYPDGGMAVIHFTSFRYGE
jgi:hypothetical protein